MITHYTLMQLAIPFQYLGTFLQGCRDNLGYFITSQDLLGEGIHSLAEINETFDLTSEEYKTIAVRINPYKRMVLNYKTMMEPVSDEERKINSDYVDYTGCKNFTEFLDLYLDPKTLAASPKNSTNAATIYIDKDINLSVSYLLEFDTFNTDVRTIPEFATVGDVDYLAEAHAACEGYAELYTEQAKARVAELFALDLATWNYTFN